MSNAIVSEGMTFQMGQGDATSVDDAGDTFDTIGEVTDFSDLPSGEAAEIDVTHMASTAKEFLVGLPDEGAFTMTLNFVPGDTGQSAARTARRNRTQKNFRVTYTDASSTIFKFKGYVISAPTSGGVDQKVTGAIGVRITGQITEA